MLTNPNIKMKPRGKAIYSVNEGNACLFDDSVTKYLESIKFPKVSFLVEMFLQSLLTVCCTCLIKEFLFFHPEIGAFWYTVNTSP